MKKVIGFISVFVACFAFLFVIASCDNSNSNPDVPVNSGTDDDVYYTITFKDYDGRILQSSSVKKGEKPIFKESNPTRISNDIYSYKFKGWNPAITVVNEDAEYIATYNEFINEYIITWKNDDGEVLEVDQNVPYGTVPEYNGLRPRKSNTYEFAYSFIGWDKQITSVTSDTTYIANYEVYSFGLEFTLNASENEYRVSGNSANTNEIIIPSKYNGLPVTSIGSSAFEGCSSLTSITLPNSIKSIGRSAFKDCSSLTSIIIPDSVTSIDRSAFYNCRSLTSISINSNNKVFDSRNNCNAIINTSTNTLIVGCKNTTIPDSVTSIGYEAFEGCSSLMSIIISDSVTSIEHEAFGRCTSLTSITIPNSVTSIGRSAFEGCTSLASITIPDSVTSIGNNAFYNCRSLTSITIPESVTSIGYEVFGDCSSLTSITIPDSVTSIGTDAFEGCSSLTSITLPNSIKIIGNGAFEGCTSLASITIPDSVTSIESGAFWFCSSLTSITIPESVTSIGTDAFRECTSLTNITLPNSITSIGNYEFAGCSSLTSITLPNSIKSIGNNVFEGCSSLTSIIIPDSVTSIGIYAFYRCSSLTSIIVNSNNKVFDSRNNCNAIINTSTNTLIVGCKNTTIPESVTSIGKYAFGDCTSLTSITIPESVTSIEHEAFYRCTSLTSINIPESVTSIGFYAFWRCYRLVEVINKSLLSITLGSTDNGYIGYYAKQIITDESDSKLSTDENGFITYNDGTDIWLVNYIGSNTEIVIPNDVTKINDYAFSSCSSLTSIIIPDSVTSIGSSAFHDCSSLTSITISDSVTSIGDNAFEGCTSLTSITIPDNVTSIGANAFLSCYRLVEVINKSLLSITLGSTDNGYIGYYAKQIITDESDSKLSTDSNGFITYNDGTDIWIVNYIGSNTKIVIPNDVTKINDYAFSSCSSLTSIIIPDSVTSIGSSAFHDCTSLTSITIPDSVTSIGDSVFYDCTSLTSITIPDNVTSIGISTFYNCTSLTKITLPNSITSIGYEAFQFCSSLTKIYYKGNMPYTDTIIISVDMFSGFPDATWYYFTSNGANETNSGNWWYYDTDGVTIIEKKVS